MSELIPRVDVEFELEADEAASAMRQHVMSRKSFWVRAVLGIVAAGMVGWAVSTGASAWWVGLAVGVGLLAALAMLVLWLFPLISVSRNPQLTQHYSFHFTSQGLDFETAETNGHLEWSRYQNIETTDAFYLLYYEKEHFTVVPRRALDASQEQALQKLIAEHVDTD